MAGEYGWGGLGGGPGGITFPDILTSLGTALLSSPRDAPFANLPQTLQTGMQASQQRQGAAAMAMALKQAGIDDATAQTLALNPTAAALAINQSNLNRKLELGAGIGKSIGQFYNPQGNMGLGARPDAPARAPAGVPSAAPSGGSADAGVSSGPLDLGNGKSPVAAAPGMTPFTALVMRAEGTDPSVASQARGFNTTLGYGKFVSGTPDLTGMTVNQILDMQKGMLNHPQNKLNSSAAGGLQVVSTTLRRLRDAGVVSGEDLYDASTQTKIGNHLAMARGPDVAGLREEWQGLKKVPPAQILAAWNASYGPNASGGAEAGAPAPDAGPPVQVAAAGKFPVPIPAAAQKPLADSGFGADTATMRELARRKQAAAIDIMTRASGMGEDGKQFLEIGKLMFDDARQYLKPTDTEAALEAAGIGKNTPEGKAALQRELEKTIPEAQRNARFAAGGSPTEDPETRRARELVRRGLPDTRPDVVKLGEAEQDTPGLTASGRQADAARKQAEGEATGRAELAKTLTSGAIAAQPLQRALKEASTAYKNVADAGGISPLETNRVARFLNKYVTADSPPDSLLRHVLPRTMTDAHSIEVERQKFENAMAMIKNSVVALRAKGQGPVSNVERVLLGEDVTNLLANPDRQIAEGALARVQKDIDEAIRLDEEKGLYRGGQSVQTPYGVVRARP